MVDRLQKKQSSVLSSLKLATGASTASDQVDSKIFALKLVFCLTFVFNFGFNLVSGPKLVYLLAICILQIANGKDSRAHQGYTRAMVAD